MFWVIFIPGLVVTVVWTWGKDLSLERNLSLLALFAVYYFLSWALAAWAEWDIQLHKSSRKYGPNDHELFLKDFLQLRDKK